MPVEKALTNYKDNPPFEFVYRGNKSGFGSPTSTQEDFHAIKNLIFNPSSYDLGKALREGYIKARSYNINITDKNILFPLHFNFSYLAIFHVKKIKLFLI